MHFQHPPPPLPLFSFEKEKENLAASEYHVTVIQFDIQSFPASIFNPFVYLLLVTANYQESDQNTLFAVVILK